MSVRQYDEEPFPYQVEHYRDLEPRQWVEVRANDVQLPVGSRGVVLQKVAESGNYQVAVEIEGEARKRVIALCPDQVRPIDPPLPDKQPEPMPSATGLDAAAKPDRLSPEARERQKQATRDYWARKKAEKAAAAEQNLKPKAKAAKPKAMPPAGDPALMTRHRPERMDEEIAAAVHGPREPQADPFVETVAAIRQLQAYREPLPKPSPRPEPLTWTRQAADAIRPVLAAAAAGGGDVAQLALLVETISYLEDGGRP